MRVLIVGASGFVGKEVLKDALARGHDVTALRATRWTPTPCANYVGKAPSVSN